MPDVTIGLHGNGQRCPACALRRETVDAEITARADVPCNACGGTGWQQDSDAQICARMVAEARAAYWPKRLAAGKARCPGSVSGTDARDGGSGPLPGAVFP